MIYRYCNSLQKTANTLFPPIGETCTAPVANEASDVAEGRKMSEQTLGSTDIEYIADMLRAVVWAKDELLQVSDETLQDLEASLATAAAALRRAAFEMREQRSA